MVTQYIVYNINYLLNRQLLVYFLLIIHGKPLYHLDCNVE